MTPPAFWYKKKSWRSWLLRPFSLLYQWGSQLRFFLSSPYKSTCPVWCVGNLTLGGTGKTPLVQALREELATIHHLNVHIVSRGYGGDTHKTPIRVCPEKHTAHQVGDEPLLLSYTGPVWVSCDKKKAIQCAEKSGADLILLDDGFQNPTIFKDYHILIWGSGKSFGNCQIFPSGPLRESISSGLKKSDALICFEPDESLLKGNKVSIPIFPLKKQVFFKKLPSKPFLAFCGLGFPDQFYTSLKESGFSVKKTRSFSDHHKYTPHDEAQLKEASATFGCDLVCTQKDWVKLSDTFKKEVYVADLHLSLSSTLKEWIKEKIKPYKRV